MVHKSDSQLIKIRYNSNIDCVMKIMLNVINSLNPLPKTTQKMKTLNKQIKTKQKIQFSVSGSWFQIG